MTAANAPRIIEREAKFYELMILYRCAKNDAEANQVLAEIAAFVDQTINKAVQQERQKHAKR